MCLWKFSKFVIFLVQNKSPKPPMCPFYSFPKLAILCQKRLFFQDHGKFTFCGNMTNLLYVCTMANLLYVSYQFSFFYHGKLCFTMAILCLLPWQFYVYFHGKFYIWTMAISFFRTSAFFTWKVMVNIFWNVAIHFTKTWQIYFMCEYNFFSLSRQKKYF